MSPISVIPNKPITIARLRFILLLLVLLPVSSWAQTISGYVMDTANSPVPYCKVYVKDFGYQTVADGNGYFLMQVQPGDYEVVFEAMGYEREVVLIVLPSDNAEVKRNVYLTIGRTLEETVIEAKRRDPAYGIMQNASKHRKEHRRQMETSTVSIYIKAMEVVDDKWQRRKDEEEREEELETRLESQEGESTVDDFTEGEQSSEDYEHTNMAEVWLTQHWKSPDDYKQIKEAAKSYGDTRGLYYLNTIEDEFDFYEALVNVPRLTHTPLISPLSPVAIVHYKFKLLDTDFLDGQFLYHIEVKPRRRSDALIEGEIWIRDSSFAIHKLDFELPKKAPIFYDKFRVKQEFQLYNDTLHLFKRQEFLYHTKTRKRDFDGRTVVRYGHWKINPEFPEKFFRNEVGVVVDSAYDRDTSYWKEVRPEPLSVEEQRYQRRQDSIKALYQKEGYLDSVDAEYNRVNFWKVLYWGVGHRNREKKHQWFFGSLWNYVEFVSMGGIRIDPSISYFKKFEDERWIYAYSYLSYGPVNNDLVGEFSIRHRYDPKHLGSIRVDGGVDYEAFNPYSSIFTTYQQNNYYVIKHGRIHTQREILNGLRLSLNLEYQDRTPIDPDYDFSYTGRWSDEVLGESEPIQFEGYQAFNTAVELSYTPFQKYISEPHRKVVLGSKWPTFYLLWEKGIPNVFGSDTDWDYLTAGMHQSFNIGTMGTSSYHLKGGQFYNTNDLRFADYKFFRFSDPIFLSNPMYTLQTLDTNLTSEELYLEAHYFHHFNGAIINRIPLLRELRIKAMAGAGALWVKEANLFHSEVLAGLERVFKAGRRRFRIGLYYAQPITSVARWEMWKGFKFSLEFYNNREGKWRF